MAVPILKYLAVDTTANQFIDLGKACGWAYLINKGPGVAFISFSAAIASAAYGDGKKELKANESLLVNNVSVQKIYARTASSTAALEAVGIPGA